MTSGPPRGVVELERLSKQYGDDAPALSDLTLRVEEGELLALLGPSGCGKTTTLRLIAGLIPPSNGCVKLDGTNITDWPSHRRDMGVVFQSYALFPHLSVGQNVAFGLEMRGVARRVVADMVSAALAMVRLDGYQQRRIRELSGGQQQRVALARALVIQPKVLLLDEPLSNLDAILRDELRHEIRGIQQRLGITTIFVTHDQVEALSMADRIAVMNQGRAIQIGSPTDIYEHPIHPFVAGFIGRINSFTAKMSSEHPATAILDRSTSVVRLPKVFDLGRPLLIMIRPHRISLRRLRGDSETIRDVTRNRMKGRIREAVYIGDMFQYRVDADDVELLCEQTTHTGLREVFAVGEEVIAEWTLNDTLVFEGNEA